MFPASPAHFFCSLQQGQKDINTKSHETGCRLKLSYTSIVCLLEFFPETITTRAYVLGGRREARAPSGICVPPRSLLMCLIANLYFSLITENSTVLLSWSRALWSKIWSKAIKVNLHVLTKALSKKGQSHRLMCPLTGKKVGMKFLVNEKTMLGETVEGGPKTYRPSKRCPFCPRGLFAHVTGQHPG
jgi:hypothetical protein